MSNRIITWEESIRSETALQGGGALRVWCYEKLGSTMDSAREHAPPIKEGEMGLVMTASQYKGRGRRGRSWLAPEAAFFGTFILPCEGRDVRALRALPLATGCAAKNALKVFGCKIYLKWPNDLFSKEGLKLGGILVETFEVKELSYVLIGIGINLAGSPLSLSSSTCLSAAFDRHVEPYALAPVLSMSLYGVWKQFLNDGFAAFKSQWLDAACFLNRDVSIVEDGSVISGVMTGVSDKGALQLKTSKGFKEIVSGDLVAGFAKGNV